MKTSDKAEFVKLLNLCYSTLLRQLPPVESLDLWMTILAPYSIEQVRVALSAHMRECKFPPVPADVVTRLADGRGDRPDANEAWAIALRSRDEWDTVVWTHECAQAFAIASEVLDVGDEVGARMAFKGAYERLVEEARHANRPAQWVVSQGFDAARRIDVVEQAVREGRLQLSQAQAAAPLLGAPSDEASRGVDVEENLARLKAIVGEAAAAIARRSAESSRRTREAAEHLAEAKRDTARRVAAYEGVRA